MPPNLRVRARREMERAFKEATTRMRARLDVDLL